MIYPTFAERGKGIKLRLKTALSPCCCMSFTLQEVAVFVFDKKMIDKYQKFEKDQIIDSLKRGVQQLTRLRHPRLLTVQHPLEESRWLTHTHKFTHVCMSWMKLNESLLRGYLDIWDENGSWQVKVKALCFLSFIHDSSKFIILFRLFLLFLFCLFSVCYCFELNWWHLFIWPSETAWHSVQSRCLPACPTCLANGTTCPALCPAISRSTSSMMWRPSMACYRWACRQNRFLFVWLRVSWWII